MRVLFVCSGNSIFGISPIVKNQGESLKKNGIELDYFPVRGKGYKGYIKNISKLKETLKSKKYEIVHAHYTYCGWVGVLQLSKIPVIVSFMGGDIHGAGEIKTKEKIVFSRYFNIFLSMLLQPFPKRIIVKSRNLEKYIYLRSKTSIIPNGVDFEKFRPLDKKLCRERLNLNTEKKIILFLGEPSEPRKNFKLLMQAYNLKKNNDIDITKPFPVPFRDVVYYLNATDVLVLTSYFEGSPNVIKEAMACNCPIVSTDVGDVKEVIGNTAGCYITTFDLEDVAEKIMMALAFGKKTDGRKNIKHLEINNIANRIIFVYKELLNSR